MTSRFPKQLTRGRLVYSHHSEGQPCVKSLGQQNIERTNPPTLVAGHSARYSICRLKDSTTHTHKKKNADQAIDDDSRQVGLNTPVVHATQPRQQRAPPHTRAWEGQPEPTKPRLTVYYPRSKHHSFTHSLIVISLPLSFPAHTQKKKKMKGKPHNERQAPHDTTIPRGRCGWRRARTMFFLSLSLSHSLWSA